MAEQTIFATNLIEVRNFPEKCIGPADAAGGFSFDFGPPKPGYVWAIERIAVVNDGILTPEVFFYDLSQGTPAGSESPQDEIEYTDAGNNDIADENSPVLIHAGSVLRAVFTGATVGSTCAVRLQISERVEQSIEIPTRAKASIVAQPIGGHR